MFEPTVSRAPALEPAYRADQAEQPDRRIVPPRVAVIVPAYGVAHLLGEALRSLQAQSFREWECVVIDDGAPDDVAGSVLPFLADPRIRFVATVNRGVSAARNRAIASTTAPLVALLDGDDMFDSHYLARMVPLLEDNADIRLATCNALIFGAVPRQRHCFTGPQGSGDGLTGTLSDVLDRSFGVYIGTTFRRADFDQIGGFDESMAQSEDFDFWIRLMLLAAALSISTKCWGIIACEQDRHHRIQGECCSATSKSMRRRAPAWRPTGRNKR